jgi:hypothetical protein
METEIQPAQIIDEPQSLPSEPYMNQMMYSQPVQQHYMPQDNSLFGSPNDLRLIQEYNKEELVPESLKHNLWGFMTKSLKLGFWNKEDERDIFIHKNLIRMGYIMSTPKHRYDFKARHQLNMLDFLAYADFKRGVGMEKYKINERTLQSTSVTQSIQGISNSGSRKGGLMAGLKSFFG